MRSQIFLRVLILAAFCPSILRADLFHYNNLLIGDRAVGMGGAYTAISDDAAGVYYNPAGLAFAVSNDVSGSANAFVTKTVRYKKAIGGRDFKEETGGSVPSFFGGLQKLDNIARGLVFSFGIYFTDNELKDQNDLIPDEIKLGSVSGTRVDDNGNVLTDSTGEVQSLHYCYDAATKVKGGERPDLLLKRYHRTSNQRGSSMYAGGALGWRLSNNVALGLGINYVSIADLIQEYQDEIHTESLCSSTGAVVPIKSQLSQNVRQNLNAKALQAVLGLQVAFLSRFSFGLSIKGGRYISQGLQFDAEKRSIQLTESDFDTVDTASQTGTYSQVNFAQVLQIEQKQDLANPLGSLPSEARMGLAYFASTRLLISADIAYISGVSDAGKLGGIDLFNKEAVQNYHIGGEYYVLPAFPLRLGYFTNYDARPKVDRTRSNQRDHIDFSGASAFLAWVQPNSQIGIGMIYQQGTGLAQKLGGYAVQNTIGSATTYTFSATHSL